MRLVRVLLTIGAMCILSVSASAAPLHWTLLGVTFDDGGKASGSFDYDASTNTFTNVDVTTTTGSTRTGAHYVAANLVAASSGFVLLLTGASGDLTGTPSFAALLVRPMTNGGSALPFALTGFHQEESCVDAGCTGGTTPRRFITGGEVVSMGIPTVSERGLILLAGLLCGVGMLALRK